MRHIKLTDSAKQHLFKQLTKQLEKGAKSYTVDLDTLLEVPVENPLELTISTQAYMKMATLVNNFDKELAWHMQCSRNPAPDGSPGTIVIEDVLVYPQVVTATTVESDDDNYEEWLMNLPDSAYNSIRGHGHSHVNMSVTPSQVDIDYSETLIQHINDYYVFIILNKRGEMSIKVYDFEAGLIYNTADIHVHSPYIDVLAWAERSIDKHITEFKYKTPPKSQRKDYSYWGSYTNQY